MRYARLFVLCCLFLLCAACGPSFLGERDPEYGAPQGGQLDAALSCAVDLALEGQNPLQREQTTSLPFEVQNAEATQAALSRLNDGATNTWSAGGGAYYSLTAYQSFVWHGINTRVISVRLPGQNEGVSWQGAALQDARKNWRLIDRSRRWSSSDTTEFYKAIDQPGANPAHSWAGDVGAVSVSIERTDVQGSMIFRNFVLKAGSVSLEGRVSKREGEAWLLEDVR